VAEIVAGLALIAGICWGVHEFLEHERDIGRNEVRAEYAQKLQEAKDAAKIREDELRVQRDDALSKGNEREQTLRTVAAGGNAASLGLRDALGTIRNGVPSATVEALRNSTSTLATVLAECQGRYRELAEKADRHASDSKTLTDAWPK
jgi:hypothetical protein